MKARFIALAALVLGMVSCQQDVPTVDPVGGEVDFQLAVAAPELVGTRAGENGEADTQYAMDSAFGAIDYLQGNATNDYRQHWDDVDLRYTLEVYDVATSYDGAKPIKDRQVVIVPEYKPVVFDLRLVPGRDYHFVVFADFVAQGSAGKTPNEQLSVDGIRHEIGETLADITLKNEAINDEVADSYFATKDIKVTNSAAQDIVLKRPYGKVRVIATDLAELNLNVHPKSVVVEYESLNPNKFNAVTGDIDGEYAVKEFTTTFVDNVRNNMGSHYYNAGYDAETSTAVNGTVRNSHITLFTDYILGENALADGTYPQTAIHFTMKVYDDAAMKSLIKETAFTTDIPVERNKLTTVIGNVLTTATEIEVRIDDNFAGEYVQSSWDGKAKEPKKDAEGNWIITEASELAWLADQVNGTTRAAGRTFEGETFKLTKDIDLNNDRWTPIGATGKFLGTFDGQNHKITNLFVSETDKTPVGLFSNARNIKNVKVIGAEIYGHYKAGVIVGDGLCAKIENCHVKDAIVKIVPLNEDDANNVGGIVGYLSAEPTAYVKGCSVKNAEITAYRKVAGIVGAANGPAEVSGNTVENVTVTADQTVEYVEFKAAEAGAIAGYKHANAKLENNTINEGVNVIVKVDADDELNAAVAGAAAGNVIEVKAGTYTFPLNSFKAAITLNCEAGVVFDGNTQLNIKGSTINGATFTSASGNTINQTINASLKNCKFIGGKNAFRYCYAGETCEFENCEIDGAVYGIHFDGGENDVTLTNCKISGFNAFAGKITKLTFNNCEFKATGKSGYNGANLWGKTEINNTTFVFDGVAGTEWIGLNAATEAGDEIKLTGCKVVDGEGNELPLFQYFANYQEGDKVTIDGVVYTVGDDSIKDAEGNYHVSSASAIKEAVKEKNATVYVYPDAEDGVYDIESKLSLAEGVRLIGVGEEPVKITNTWSSNLFAYQAHFTDTYMENICADNNLVIDAGIANGNVVFKKCIFGGDRAHQGVHFDSGNGTITFDECTLIGRNMLGSSIEKVTFNKCYFENKRSSLTGADKWTGVNMWGKYEFNECTFGTEAHCSVKCDDVVAAFNNCSFVDARDITSVVNYDGEFDAEITFNGNKYIAEGKLEDAEGNTIATSVAGLKDALKEGEDVILAGDMAVKSSESDTNGYGKTGFNMTNGGTIDGGGNDISINAWSTWDSVINTTGGTIKNINVTGGMRGIFVNHNSTNCSKVYLDNVVVDGTIYTISCDQGTNNGLEATNSTFNGWTSYAATIGDVKFTNCNFGEGQGYAYCRPYAPTEFVGCEFEAGFTLEPCAAVTFENCTLNGVALTDANIADLVTDTTKATIK